MTYAYTLTSSTLAANAQPIQRSDGAWIPADPANTDYQNYLIWLGVAGNAPTPLATPALAVARASAIAQVIAYANAITSQITAKYPQGEIDSWSAQLGEARIVQAGGTPPAPSLLQAMVTASNPTGAGGVGYTMASLAAVVVTNATNYQNIVASLQATRGYAQAEIAAATDVAGVATIMAAIKASANAQATALGLTPPAV